MRIEPLRSSVLQRLLRLLLPSTTHPVHAAVVCWLIAPLTLGMRPEVMSWLGLGLGLGLGLAHPKPSPNQVMSGTLDAWAAVHLLLEHARAEESGRREGDAQPPEGTRWLEIGLGAAVGARVAGVTDALGMAGLGVELLGDAGHMLVVTASVPGAAAAAAAAAAEGREPEPMLHVGDVLVGMSGAVLSRSAAATLRKVTTHGTDQADGGAYLIVLRPAGATAPSPSPPGTPAGSDNPNPNPSPSPIPGPNSNPNPNLCGGVGPERSHALDHRRGLAQELAEGRDQVARKLLIN